MRNRRIVTLFEHQERAYADLGWTVDHPIVQALDEVNRAHGREIFRLGRKSFRPLQHVGVIRVGKVDLEILPKVDFHPGGSSDAPLGSQGREFAVRSASENLLEMMRYAYGLPPLRPEDASISLQRGTWLDLLTWLFASELHGQALKGLNRSYIPLEEASRFLRGRWDVQRQLLRRPVDRHRFEVLHDDFSLDTQLNRVFRLVTQRLLMSTDHAPSRTLLTDLRLWLDETEHVERVDPSDLERLSFSRLSDRFRPAFNLARMLLENSVPDLRVGATDIVAVLIDMNLLFERFVAGFLRSHKSRILPLAWGGARLISQMEGYRAFLLERLPDQIPTSRVIPDICVQSPTGRILAIADTKYKVLDKRARAPALLEADAYQMLAYGNRLDCRCAVVISPSAGRHVTPTAEFRSVSDDRHLISTTLDLHSPLREPTPLVERLRAVFAQAERLA